MNPTTDHQDSSRPAGRTFWAAATGAWCTYLVIDFMVHAVFLASYWRATEAYWLPPLELLRRIPLAYLLFAIHSVVLTWLLRRLYPERLSFATGLRFGALAGLFLGISSALGNYTVFRMPPSALLVGPASVTSELAAAGAVAAWVLVAKRPWRRVALVFLAALVLFVVGVVIQNLFFPTPAEQGEAWQLPLPRGVLRPERSLSLKTLQAADTIPTVSRLPTRGSSHGARKPYP